MTQQPMTPSEQERRARERIEKMFDGWRKATAEFVCDDSGVPHLLSLEQAALDAYAAAVRRAAFAEAVAVVDRLIHWRDQPDGRPWIDQDEALTALRGLSPEEV